MIIVILAIVYTLIVCNFAFIKWYLQFCILTLILNLKNLFNQVDKKTSNGTIYLKVWWPYQGGYEVHMLPRSIMNFSAAAACCCCCLLLLLLAAAAACCCCLLLLLAAAACCCCCLLLLAAAAACCCCWRGCQGWNTFGKGWDRLFPLYSCRKLWSVGTLQLHNLSSKLCVL